MDIENMFSDIIMYMYIKEYVSFVWQYLVPVYVTRYEGWQETLVSGWVYLDTVQLSQHGDDLYNGEERIDLLSVDLETIVQSLSYWAPVLYLVLFGSFL